MYKLIMGAKVVGIFKGWVNPPPPPDFEILFFLFDHICYYVKVIPIRGGGEVGWLPLN